MNLFPAILFFAGIASLLIIFKDEVAFAYSGESYAAQLEAELMPLTALYVFLLCVYRVISAPLYATGMQK